MMQLFGALILFLTLSGACGLRCYTCMATDPKSCTDTKSCLVGLNRCYSSKPEGLDVVTKGCLISTACIDGIDCCEGDLCNGSAPTGSSVVLLLVSSAIITLFL